MKKIFLIFSIFVSLRCCVSELAIVADGFQPWVTNPRYSLYPSLPIAAPESKNDICKFHSRMLLEHLKNKTLWAMQMWDSSAKSPVGVLSGNIFHLGNFDECLKTQAPFDVKFCVGQVFASIPPKFARTRLRDGDGVSWKSNAWTNIARSQYDPSKAPRDVLNWGLCVPATCKSSELEEAINSHLATIGGDFHNETTFRINLNEDFCTRSKEERKLSPGVIAFCVFSFILILLTASSTFVDFVPASKEEKKSSIYRLWMFFSVKQNFSYLVPSKKGSDSPLNVLHGIKFLSILPIVFGHRIGVSLALSATNYNEIEDDFVKDHKMFFVQSDLVVDTFFFISGLLASTALAEIYTKQFINPIVAIFVRFIRLSVLYFFIMWYQGTIAFRLGSGPLWNALARNETEFCVRNWWTNVLFINNYVKSEEMCMPHSWFLPCEMHFFTLAVILVPIAVKYPKSGKILLGFVTFVSAIIPAMVIFITKTSPLILFYYDFFAHPRENGSFNLLYIRSHNRATVYLIGTALGLFLHHKKDCKKILSVKTTLIGCLVWLAFLFAPMAYGSLYYDLNKEYNVIESAIFGSLRRVSWGIGFAIFILCHRFGTIPFIDLIFSSRIAIFFSRITFGIYLLHFNFITSEVLTSRSAKRFTVNEMVVEGIGDLLKAALGTVILIFILEIPLKRISREFFFAKKLSKIQKPPPEITTNKESVFTIRL